MCSGLERKPEPTKFVMESEVHRQDGLCLKFSILLELAASDDLLGFRNAIEEESQDIDEASFWYGRKIGSKKMGFELRTPLMIAAMFGSKNVLTYIVGTRCVDLNRSCGSDGATALHLAASGGALNAPEVVRILLDGLADADAIDATGNRPGDLIAPVSGSASYSRRKILEVMLNGQSDERVQESLTPRATKDGSEKKEYPIDLSLPDIKNGIYGTDEFRMYAFKIKPCSRAYSHDWTECPFVHPGENARRRDPRKYHYSCVPCPEFRKGSCRQGDACEYAHGIFECWLHPAQYRTRLCKDETGCNRRVCFFAHKPEELRPLYASTGSAVPSPKSFSMSATSLEMASISPLGLCSSPPLTPTGASSPSSRSLWQNQNQNQANVAPLTLQLPGSRLKSTFSARDIDFDMHCLQQQQLMDDLYGLSSPSSWNNPFSASSGDRNGEVNRLGGIRPSNLEDLFGSLDCAASPQLQGLTMDNGSFLRQNMNQQRLSSYPANRPLSPARASPTFGIEHSSAAAVLSSRSSAFAKRSQSFIERHHSGLSSPAWSSPGGKLDWSMQGDELNKLRKSASFGIRSTNNTYAASNPVVDEPDVSWVQSLVKDMPSENLDQFRYNVEEKNQKLYSISTGGSEVIPAWAEQLYPDQEQMVA